MEGCLYALPRKQTQQLQDAAEDDGEGSNTHPNGCQGSDILFTLIHSSQMNVIISLKNATDYINPDEDRKQDLALDQTDTGKCFIMCLYAHVQLGIKQTN